MNYRITTINNANEEVNDNSSEEEFIRDVAYNYYRNENGSNSSERNNINTHTRNIYNYNVDNDLEIESNINIIRDDLRIIGPSRNNNRAIRRQNNARTSTRYNLRNNIINNDSSHSNSINRNIENNNNNTNASDNNTTSRNYNLRNRDEIIINNDDDFVINSNDIIINNKQNRKKNIIEDDEDEVMNKKDKIEDDEIIIVNKSKEENIDDKKKEKDEKEKEKGHKEKKRHYKRHGHDDEDEDYVDTESPKRRRRKWKKRGRKKKVKPVEEDEEDDDDSDYHDSESEENKDTNKGVENEEDNEKKEKEEKENNKEKETKDDSDIEMNKNDDEANTTNSKPKKYKKLVKKNNRSELNEESDTNEEKSKNKENKEEGEDINTDSNNSKNNNHKLLTSEIFDGTPISPDSTPSPKKDEKEKEKERNNKIINDHLPHTCYFCHQTFTGDKHSSIKIFGPFYYNETTGKISPNKLNENNEKNEKEIKENKEEVKEKEGEKIKEKEIYVDINCFIDNSNNKDVNYVFNPLTSIEEVIKQGKICFRCGNPFASKKCNLCQKMFHGNLCFNQMTEEYNDKRYCLECYKKEYAKVVQEKIRPKKIYYEKLGKKYFLQKKIYNSQYYPQKGEEVYFILHAYIQFLNDKYQYFMYEINSEKQRLFWWMENPILEKNPRFSFYEPFLCKVKNIEYIFPNNKTIVLIKEKDTMNQFYNNLKILVKLQLEIIELKNYEITIILFENDNPDFLVRKKIYEETYKYYNKNISNQSGVNFKVNLSEDIIKVILVEDKPEENNENFGKSKFNSLKVLTEKEKDEQKYSFWDICANGNNNELISDKMKYIMSGLKSTIISIYEKNKIEVEIFWEMVSEEDVVNYYNEVPVPMFLKLILTRLENEYYITEESIKFDIQLLLDNVKTYNTEFASISKDAEIVKNRLFNRIEQLSSKYENKKPVISNGTNIKIKLNSDSGGSGTGSTKKMIGKKRKRKSGDIDKNENLMKDYDDTEDYLFSNTKDKKKENKSNSNHNHININNNDNKENKVIENNGGNNIKKNNNDISIDIHVNNGKDGSVVKKKKKRKMF